MSRILAVDDDQGILEVLQFILEDSGYEVKTISDGHQLFDAIREGQPDLILMDIMLNGLDGRDLCKHVKSNDTTHDIPVIMISASHSLGDVLHQENAPDDFLAKPFDINVLLSKIERQLAA
ncbi:response regulator [Mucilaginibacter daejeonensis]|uniref:response regulator transcription factor n=1 Tax=Mucilaginibacter daejeonensis TaxID=398049 RepID=UPI001D17CAD6|nr:response regulator [Mucilaginibacter daejeonensis]UEG52376.1 response regulator [Mucilaginibacter daejeonensis]